MITYHVLVIKKFIPQCPLCRATGLSCEARQLDLKMCVSVCIQIDVFQVTVPGKAPGLDDIQTELIKQFGPKARDWLLRFFNNCTETTTIPKI